MYSSCSYCFCDVQLIFIICRLFPVVNGLLYQEICDAQTIFTLLKLVHTKKFDRSILNAAFCINHLARWEKDSSSILVPLKFHICFLIHILLTQLVRRRRKENITVPLLYFNKPHLPIDKKRKSLKGN